VNISKLKVIETDETHVIVGGLWEVNSFRQITENFASRLRMTEKKLQRQ
jgi:hypothetical protein